MKDMENGKVVLDYDTTEGINIDDENFIDDRNDSDVGNIVIGINPTQIGAATHALNGRQKKDKKDSQADTKSQGINPIKAVTI